VDVIEHARSRLAAALAEIDRLKQSEFPYSHSVHALDIIQGIFQQHDTNLAQLSEATPIALVHNECKLSLRRLFLYLPILGFVLRSTNRRNAFEVYSPLLRLARRLVGPSARLILSSEWDYSPFTFAPMAEIPDYVLIGLPASESANPLLIPLSGHELGHRLWKTEHIGDQYQQTLLQGVVTSVVHNHWVDYHDLHPDYTQEDLTQNIAASSTLQLAVTLAGLQAEEIFNDILAIRLFHESYLHAFAYLASPGTPGPRPVKYPNLQRRVRHMHEAADQLGVQTPDEFETWFADGTEPAEPNLSLQTRVADEVSAGLVPSLIQRVEQIGNDRQIPGRTAEAVQSIVREFEKVIPTRGSHALTDIVNAAWSCARRADLWHNVAQIRPEERRTILHEIVLKSIEVSEIAERVAPHP